ncbi:hypothetical protein DFH08DRAFT_1049375 [Mycena albidolilacea]|uniref:Uncharacterized protein n=1 Tax=Mycena albidolilacea TaxID=1033008 RepID=A0AAD6Z6X6_9AGAR|nr:hypothetical protein DFH08DRAFT_1049375 [Mycena albidolilacea]
MPRRRLLLPSHFLPQCLVGSLYTFQPQGLQPQAPTSNYQNPEPQTQACGWSCTDPQTPRSPGRTPKSSSRKSEAQYKSSRTFKSDCPPSVSPSPMHRTAGTKSPEKASNVEWDGGSEKWIQSDLLRDQIDKDMASKTKVDAKTRFDARRWDGPGGIWLLSVATLASPEGTGVRTQGHESNRVRAVRIVRNSKLQAAETGSGSMAKTNSNSSTTHAEPLEAATTRRRGNKRLGEEWRTACAPETSHGSKPQKQLPFIEI